MTCLYLLVTSASYTFSLRPPSPFSAIPAPPASKAAFCAGQHHALCSVRRLAVQRRIAAFLINSQLALSFHHLCSSQGRPSTTSARPSLVERLPHCNSRALLSNFLAAIDTRPDAASADPLRQHHFALDSGFIIATDDIASIEAPRGAAAQPTVVSWLARHHNISAFNRQAAAFNPSPRTKAIAPLGADTLHDLGRPSMLHATI